MNNSPMHTLFSSVYDPFPHFKNVQDKLREKE